MSSTGITLTDSRLYLEGVLTSAGLPVMPHAGQLHGAPGVMVVGDDLLRAPNLAELEYLSRWRLSLTAGMADFEGILDQLNTMLALTLQALHAAGVVIERGPLSKPYLSRSAENTLYLARDVMALIPVSLATNPDPTP